MDASRLRRLAVEVFKTLKSLYPDFMHVNRAKTAIFGEKRLRTLGPKIWNSLPEDIKDLTSLPKFTEFIKIW